MKKANTKIDVVIPWVDGNDPAWLEEKKKYDSESSGTDDGSNSRQRFRDWGLMRYWFRGMEKYMPFVNKIFFVTWGHIPEWLNTDNEKLVIVNHKDYIPEKYLPTFNSNVIDLNFHRIKGLSENFIIFNDDIFTIAPAREDIFFKNDLPCDMLLSVILYNYNVKIVFWHSVFNNLGIINKHFGTHRRELRNIPKWLHPSYGFKNMLTNLNKLYFRKVVGFKDHHLAIPNKKSVFEEVWELEGDALDRACMNKFRSPMDLTNWLMRYWNFMTGKFEPVNLFKIGEYCSFEYDDSIDYICERIKKQERPIFVINDTLDNADENQFLEYQKKIIEAFESILPDRCSFEKE